MQRPSPFSSQTRTCIAAALGRGLRRREVCRELGIHHSRLYREIERFPEFAEWLHNQEAATRWTRESRAFDIHPARRHKMVPGFVQT